MVRYEEVTARRFLTRTLIHNGAILPLSIVDFNGNSSQMVSSFEMETSETVFENHPVAIIAKNKTTLDVMKELNNYLIQLSEFNLKSITEYLQMKDLFINTIQQHQPYIKNVAFAIRLIWI